MKKILSILITSYKNYTAYFPDVVWTNIILVLRIIVLSILYWYLYKNFWTSWKIEWYTVIQITYAVVIAQIISTAKPKLPAEIGLEVKSWKIVSYLLNPINYVYFKFLEYFPVFIYNVIIGLILWFIICFMILWVFPLSIWWILWWLILLILSMVTVFFWYMIVWLAAFYMEDNEAFRFIYSKLDMVLWWNLIPIPFLPGILQIIAYSSPFAYFWYTTWLVFTNFEFILFLKYLFIQIFWLVINLIICLAMYKHAKNKLTINWG